MPALAEMVVGSTLHVIRQMLQKACTFTLFRPARLSGHVHAACRYDRRLEDVASARKPSPTISIRTSQPPSAVHPTQQRQRVACCPRATTVIVARPHHKPSTPPALSATDGITPGFFPRRLSDVGSNLCRAVLMGRHPNPSLELPRASAQTFAHGSRNYRSLHRRGRTTRPYGR